MRFLDVEERELSHRGRGHLSGINEARDCGQLLAIGLDEHPGGGPYIRLSGDGAKPQRTDRRAHDKTTQRIHSDSRDAFDVSGEVFDGSAVGDGRDEASILENLNGLGSALATNSIVHHIDDNIELLNLHQRHPSSVTCQQHP